MVKADAYGHGAIPVARALVGAGADGLCVATLDEALALRVGGVGGPIHVLYPIPASGVGEAASAGLSVTIGDRESEESLLGAVARLPAGTASLGVHVEVETGPGTRRDRPGGARRPRWTGSTPRPASTRPRCGRTCRRPRTPT